MSQKIHQLFSSPEKWTRGASAREQNGAMVPLESEYAVCWCLSGAIQKCYGSHVGEWIWSRIRRELPENIIDWNDADERTFEEVKELVTRLDV